MTANTKSTDSMAIMAMPDRACIARFTPTKLSARWVTCRELMKAVCNGDLSTIGDLCARLFYLNFRPRSNG